MIPRDFILEIAHARERIREARQRERHTWHDVEPIEMTPDIEADEAEIRERRRAATEEYDDAWGRL